MRAWGWRASLVLALFAALPLSAAARRVIIFKFDGVNAALVDKSIAQTNPRTGRSQLPWINKIFAHHGTRLQNFLVRGISLSAPSWAQLDSGRHSVVRGNVEYDRWTLHAYDYLNFVPFYLNYSQKKQVDMPGVEVLDDAGIPLLIDAFQPGERRQSYQLYQRGNDWGILKNSLPNHFKVRSPREIFDQYETGLDLSGTIAEEQERRVIEALADPQIAYFDFFSGDYDHVAHLTTDPASQLAALQSVDALIGRIWSAAQASSLGPETLFVLVSDHGMNTDPKVPAQGYNLVNWFNSTAGGAQHVITDRYPLSTFKIRGLDPLIHKVTTPSAASLYLKDEADHYPTLLLDLDGNERAAVQLRSNDWNIAQILLQAANSPRTADRIKAAARTELGRWAESRRAPWAKQKEQTQPSLDALERTISRAESEFARLNRTWTEADRTAGKDLEARRWHVLADRLREQKHEYRTFANAVDSFLAMPSNAPASLVPRQSLGDANSLFDLQNYVVGPGPSRLKLDAGGRIDLDHGFQRIDYFEALTTIRVRNQVPPGVSNNPIDFEAVALPVEAVANSMGEAGLLSAVWLHATADRQALVLYRKSKHSLEIRYIPVAHLRAAKDGTLTFLRPPWTDGFPLALCKDSGLKAPAGDRTAWLSAWHSEADWFAALLETRYSNALIGLSELFRPIDIETPAWIASAAAPDRAALLHWERLRRTLVQPDFEIFAADHWDFNVRNFNPGGNHGAFWRASTRSVLMFSGASVPAGLTIPAPYDSLSLAPTILQLTGRTLPDLPGKPIVEITSPEPAH